MAEAEASARWSKPLVPVKPIFSSFPLSRKTLYLMIGRIQTFRLPRYWGVGRRKVAGSHHLLGRSHLKEIATCPNDGKS